MRTYLNSEYYLTCDDKMNTRIYIRGWARTLTNLNMIDRQLMSSGIVSRDAFFCHNRNGKYANRIVSDEPK